jgi:hypothetical protein
MPNGTATLPEEQLKQEQRIDMGRKDRRTGEAVGAATGGLVAAVAGILAIVGLTGLYPTWLVSISAMGIGVSFLLEGIAIVARLSDFLHEATDGRIQMAELGAGTTGETLAGITGVALGLLGLLGIAPVVLILCASIVFGAALVIGSRTKVFMHKIMVTYREEHPMARQMARQAVFVTAALQVVMGIAVFTLAIIALTDIAPLTLSLVAVLIAAAALVLTNPAIASRMAPVLRP